MLSIKVKKILEDAFKNAVTDEQKLAAAEELVEADVYTVDTTSPAALWIKEYKNSKENKFKASFEEKKKDLVGRLVKLKKDVMITYGDFSPGCGIVLNKDSEVEIIEVVSYYNQIYVKVKSTYVGHQISLVTCIGLEDFESFGDKNVANA